MSHDRCAMAHLAGIQGAGGDTRGPDVEDQVLTLDLVEEYEEDDHRGAVVQQTLALDAGKKISPFCIPALLGNTASGIVGIELGAQGPNFGVASACAAGSHAIGELAATLLRKRMP